MIELGQEDCETEAAERDDAGVYAVDGYVGEVTVGDETSLVFEVVFHGVCHVDAQFLVSGWGCGVFTKVGERVVRVNLL